MTETSQILTRQWNLEAANHVGLDGFPDISIARWVHQELELPAANSPTHGIVVARASFDCTRIIGQKTERVRGKNGDVGFVSAGDLGRWQFRQPVDVIHIYVAPEMLARCALDTGLPSMDLQTLPFQAVVGDPLATALALEVARAVDPDAPSRLYIDQMMRSLALRLVALNYRVVERDLNKGGLALWQVRRVQEFIAANLAADVSLAEIAAISGLSQFHFARAFKKTVGVPPHTYQRQLRLERACALLADPRLSILDVSLSVGFDSPQAFARTFRREIGLTPTHFRRLRLI